MTLTQGVIDGAAQHAFTYGACGGLAIALHEQTGWPLIVVTDVESVYGSDHGPLADEEGPERHDTGNHAGMGASGLHWLVLHPSGQLLDVDGLHDPAEIAEQYDGEADSGICGLGRASLEDAREEYVDAKGEPVPLETCEEYAAALLVTLGR